MRLIFVNRFYWPETPATGQLLTDLAEALAARGHDVTLITSGSARSAGQRWEVHNGVRIWRIRGTRWACAGLLGKAVDFATFYFGAMLRLLMDTSPGATVIALTDPPLLAVGAGIVARWRRARVVHWVQDIYPELAIELAGQRWLGFLQPWRNRAWRGATACVTLGSDMAAVLAHAGVAAEKIKVVPNWAPAGTVALPRAAGAALRAEWGLGDRFVVAYSGNLGRVHDLEPVLAIADRLRDEPHIAFLFIGDGAQRASLQSAAASMALPNVSFRPPQPRARLAEALAVGDLHLVTLRPGCERLVFPSKLYGIAAAGRPVCFIGPRDCEVARIVREQGLGQAAARDDAVEAAAFIRSLARNPAAADAHSRAALRFAQAGDVSAAVGAWEKLLVATEA